MSLVTPHELEMKESFYGAYGYNTEEIQELEQKDRHGKFFKRLEQLEKQFPLPKNCDIVE